MCGFITWPLINIPMPIGHLEKWRIFEKDGD